MTREVVQADKSEVISEREVCDQGEMTTALLVVHQTSSTLVWAGITDFVQTLHGDSYF